MSAPAEEKEQAGDELTIFSNKMAIQLNRHSTHDQKLSKPHKTHSRGTIVAEIGVGEP
jgi:hypothetical protein